MKNLIINIYGDTGFIGKIQPSFEKYDFASKIFRTYDAKSNSYQDVKVTIELMKPNKIEKFSKNELPDYMEVVEKINVIIDQINNQKS